MHGLSTIVFLNANNLEAAAIMNATDPGHSNARRAEAELAEAVSRLAEDATGHPTGTEFGNDFIFAVHDTEGWLLPINRKGRDIAARVFPDRFRRYGLHYILDLTSERDDAILQSIRAIYE